jgi:hypothetical protein
VIRNPARGRLASLSWRVLLATAALFLTSAAEAQTTLPTLSAPPSSTVPSQCLDQAAIERAGAVSRDPAKFLGLCLTLDEFDEGPLRWRLLIAENPAAPRRILWVVPHDNEGDAFDTAVYGARIYGGTVVAAKTGGARMNGKQDPNRNFDTGTGAKCPLQVARSPVYTRRFLRWWDGHAPILALHTNERGYQGDGRGGRGTITMARNTPGLVRFRARSPIGASPDDTMVYVASLRPPAQDRSLMDFVRALNGQGVNVVYEVVTPAQSDCSLSNYAALVGAPHYFNFEVVETDGPTQRRMVDVVTDLLGLHRLAP